MKQLSLLLCLMVTYTAGMAQMTCDNPHKIFKLPAGKTPKIVEKLGSAPQFTSLRRLNSADDVYNKMKALNNNSKYGNEINSLLKSLGYTGVNDPSFDRYDIKKADIPFGAIGMLGETGHGYEYSMIAIPNQPTADAWYINPANNGCGLYVMSDCGNAFYYSNPTGVESRERVIVEKYVNPDPAKLKLNVYARYREADCEWCGNCDLPGEANITEHKVLLAQEDIDEIPSGTDTYPVKNVYIDVDKKTFKRIKNMPENPNGDNTVGETPDGYAGLN